MSELENSFNCTLCSAKGIRNEATVHCEECANHLCPACVEQHNIFTLMKGHAMLDISGMKHDTEQAQSESISISERCEMHYGNRIDMYCEDHYGNRIDMYCEDHFTLCCGTCATLNHRACPNVVHILLAAKGIKTSQEYFDVTENLKLVHSDLTQFRIYRIQDKSRITQEKEKAKTMIREHRKKSNLILDDLEMITINKIECKEVHYQEKIKADVIHLDKRIAEVESSLKQLESFQGENESQLFVYVKNGIKAKKDGIHSLNEIGRGAEHDEIIININENNEYFLNS